MDTESLRQLIRAIVFAAPLAVPLTACGGAPPPSRPVVNLESPPAPAEPDPGDGTAPTEGTGTEVHARSDGTMDSDEFDRQWRQSLGGGGPEPEPQIMVIEGRPLTSSAGPVRAQLQGGAGWGDAAVFARRPRVAARWLAAALAEHASVASFARAVIELSAVGAPAVLLEGHLKAGLDEVRHTSISFEMAARFGASNRAPGPMAVPPPREASLPRLAADTFAEGCVNETIAALVATRAAAGCQDPVVSAALETIAEDEARHAALAWQTVRWALESDPAPVRARLAEVVLPAPEGGERAPQLAQYGLLDGHEANRAARDAVSRVVRPLLEELLEG